MRVVAPKTIRQYGQRHPDAEEALLVWLKVARSADWGSIRDVRIAYPHADAVTVASGRVVTVFNIRGNRYRLIVAIHYQWSMVYVLGFLTHAEYDKEKWKATL